MDMNRRRSSLLSQLEIAQSKLATLEDFIKEREKQFRSAVTRLERHDSRPIGPRSRRVGLSHNLWSSMRSMSSEEGEEEQGWLKLRVKV